MRQRWQTFKANLPWIVMGVALTCLTHVVIHWLRGGYHQHYILVHIPKTGGTAVNGWVDMMQLQGQCLDIRTAHTHYLDTQHARNMGYHPISIIREPTERFISSFYYWKYGSEDIANWQREKNWRTADDINTPEDLIQILKDTEHPRHKTIKTALLSRDNFTHRHHFMPQTLWLTAPLNKSTIICYDNQHLQSNIQNAFKKLNIHCPMAKLPYVNRSKKPDTQIKLSSEAQQWLATIYADDYQLWHQHCTQTAEQ